MSTLNGYNPNQIRTVLDRTGCNRTIVEVILHHTENPIKSYRGLDTIRAIRDYHVNQLGWRDVGYHYLVGPDGIIWEGRPLADVGAHCANKTVNRNPQSVGVSLVMDGNKETPTAAQVASFVALHTGLCQKFGLNLLNGLKFHRDYLSTDCPGNLISHAMVTGWLTGNLGEGGHAETDVAAWAKKAVDRVKKAGIMKGDPDGSFRGFEQLSRQEFAVAVDRLMDWVTAQLALSSPAAGASKGPSKEA